MTVLIIALLVLAIVLLICEALILPGFGVAGLAGVAALAGAITVSFLHLGPLWGSGALIASLGIALGTLWLLPRTHAGRALVLKQVHANSAAPPELVGLVGRRGRALTVLRPAGAAEFDGQRVDVVTDGDFVEAGTPVRVVDVQGARVVVHAASE